MKIDFTISSLSRSSGGTSACVCGLARGLAKLGHRVRLFTVTSSRMIRPEPEECEGVEIVDAPPSWPYRLAASAGLKRMIGRVMDTDLFHGHGLWDLPMHYGSKFCRRKGLPYVMSAHGMLEPWALERSYWKKRVMGRLYQNKDLSRADCLHALTNGEMKSFRDYGLKNPIAIVPNGIDLDGMDRKCQSRALFEEKCPQTRGHRILLYLSRLHPKKGLMSLVEAWAGIHKNFPDWMLVLAGPDQLGHRAEVERVVVSLNSTHSVLFTGPLYEELKLSALTAAQGFILPSFSEGFSVAVIEALACRLPVIITPGCNFPEVVREKAGLICESEPRSMAEALRALLGMSDRERQEMGARGRRMIEAGFTRDRVAQTMEKVYEWILGHGPRPDCVLMD